jgi:hypothetical protein
MILVPWSFLRECSQALHIVLSLWRLAPQAQRWTFLVRLHPNVGVWLWQLGHRRRRLLMLLLEPFPSM